MRASNAERILDFVAPSLGPLSTGYSEMLAWVGGLLGRTLVVVVGFLVPVAAVIGMYLVVPLPALVEAMGFVAFLLAYVAAVLWWSLR